jgi:hypothetical protein
VQSWQCHSPEGTFSASDIAVPESATEFAGEMLIHKANKFSRWNPSAKIAFTDIDADNSACHCNGVVATWYPDNPEFFFVSLVVDGNNIGLGLVPYDKPVTFKLKFAHDGALRLEVGTGVRTGVAPLPKRNNLHLSCSTADVDFRMIEVR